MPDLRDLLTALGVILTGAAAFYTARNNRRASDRTTDLNERTQKAEEVQEVIAGAMALASGVRAELNAVLENVEKERRMAREREASLVGRIEALEQAKEDLEQELDEVRTENRNLRSEVTRLKAANRRRPNTKTRSTDHPEDR